MKISILGTGAIGLGYAALLSSRGHDVNLWSPSGKGVEELRETSGVLCAEGTLEGKYDVSASLGIRDSVVAANVVIFAIPGNGHAEVMRMAATYLRSEQTVLVAPIVSLSAYILAKLVIQSGISPLICASPTTMLTARKMDGACVRVLTIRPQVELSSFPCAQVDRAAAEMGALFGCSVHPQRNLLVSSLSNIGPVVHVPLALMNMTRMERGEHWLQYEHFTQNVSRVIVAIDRERLLLGAALGFSLRSVEDHFCRSFGAQSDTLENIATQIVKIRDGGPSGPGTAETRFLTEDAPFGLAFYSYIGKLLGVPTPVSDACITLASIAINQDVTRVNDLLTEVGKAVSTKDDLIELFRENSPI
ncbi:NAD/NADP octopine/nopaline dehydrogenase family protein [Paraburkholderia xenovorans]|jgi:opine dehydrogenase